MIQTVLIQVDFHLESEMYIFDKSRFFLDALFLIVTHYFTDSPDLSACFLDYEDVNNMEQGREEGNAEFFVPPFISCQDSRAPQHRNTHIRKGFEYLSCDLIHKHNSHSK